MTSDKVMTVLGLCVCGKGIAASIDPPCVIHELPPCDAFKELDPDEFLTYVRRSRGIPDSAVIEQ